jgi:hypothetical protein
MAAVFKDSDKVEIDGYTIHRVRGTSPTTGNPQITYLFGSGAKAA